MKTTCKLCGEPRGVNPDCHECSGYASQVTKRKARNTVSKAEAFIDSPPWYARVVPEIFWKRLGLLNSMAKAYVKGEYRQVPWSTIASVVLAVAYVICPTDLVPDVFFPLGFLDDAAVVSLVFKSLEHELDKYTRFSGKEAK